MDRLVKQTSEAGSLGSLGTRRLELEAEAGVGSGGGRTRPEWAPSHNVLRHVTRPSQPMATVCPTTAISTSHMSSTSSHAMKHPSWTSSAPPPPSGSCTMPICTLSVAHMLFTVPWLWGGRTGAGESGHVRTERRMRGRQRGSRRGRRRGSGGGCALGPTGGA